MPQVRNPRKLILVVLAVTYGADQAARGVELRAAEQTLAAAVHKLFEVGWSTGFSARAATDQQFRVVNQLAPHDPLARYAYALINIKQRRYDEANQLLDQLIRSNPREPQLWRAKIWLSVLTRNFTRSVVEMDQLASLLPAEPTARSMETAKFLGILYGYLGGPVEDSVDDALVTGHRQRLLAGLSSVHKSIFEEAHRATVEQHASLTAELERIAAEALVTAKADREKLLADLDRQEREIAQRRETLGPRRDQLAADMRDELAEIRKEDQPLADRITELESQALVIRRDSFWVNSEMSRMHTQSQGTRDPAIRDAFLRELNRLSFLSSQYLASLRALERRGAAINQQRREIQQRYQRTEASYKERLAKLSEEERELDRQEKRLTGTRQRAEKPARADVRRTRSLSDQARALTTYLEFPLEAEKIRVLESLR